MQYTYTYMCYKFNWASFFQKEKKTLIWIEYDCFNRFEDMGRRLWFKKHQNSKSHTSNFCCLSLWVTKKEVKKKSRTKTLNNNIIYRSTRNITREKKVTNCIFNKSILMQFWCNLCVCVCTVHHMLRCLSQNSIIHFIVSISILSFFKTFCFFSFHSIHITTNAASLQWLLCFTQTLFNYVHDSMDFIRVHACAFIFCKCMYAKVVKNFLLFSKWKKNQHHIFTLKSQSFVLSYFFADAAEMFV